MQVMARRGARAALPGVLLLAATWTWAASPRSLQQAGRARTPPARVQEASPAPEVEPPAAAPPAVEAPRESVPSEAAPSVAPPQVESPFLSRIYKIRPGKLWKGLLETLQAEGFPPEEVDDEAKAVKTSFVDFDQNDYQNQVAEPPPHLGGDYHVLQMLKVTLGKVSLESRIAPGKQGTELRLRARILVTGLDRVRRVRVLVDRRSTGVIEAALIHKLEARMGLEHL